MMIFCPSIRRATSYTVERCTYGAGHHGEHRYCPLNSSAWPSRPVPQPCEPCGGVGIANGRVCWACDGTGDPDGYDRLECSTQRVGDREWYCDTHKRNAEICQEAVDL